MPGQLTYNLEDYQQSCRTYRRDMLRLPILALQATLQYMTLRPGIRYEEVVGTTAIDVELQPWKRGIRTSNNLDLKLRALHTYFGALNADFCPNEAISTLMGHRAAAAAGDALATTPQAHEVIALTPKAVGRKLAGSIFDAKHDPEGTTTKTLFNGFDTITDDEIKAGNIAEAKGNYHKLSEPFDNLNAVEIAHEILVSMSPELREQECNLYCSYDFADAYSRAYKLETGGISYNQSYDQLFVEGSGNRLRIVPLVGKTGSRFMQVSPKENMLVGVDQVSDTETISVGCFGPDEFTVMMRMFFGVQFESIDPRRLLVIEIPEAQTVKPDDSGKTPGSDDSGKTPGSGDGGDNSGKTPGSDDSGNP